MKIIDMIMKNKKTRKETQDRETSEIQINVNKYKQSWSQFSEISPTVLMEICLRPGTRWLNRCVGTTRSSMGSTRSVFFGEDGRTVSGHSVGGSRSMARKHFDGTETVMMALRSSSALGRAWSCFNEVVHRQSSSNKDVVEHDGNSKLMSLSACCINAPD